MFIQELATKQAMEPCVYCTEKKEQINKYKEDIEKEKVAECLKALERQKIAKGMQCSKEDEIRLREMQRMQMYEKKCMELEEEDRDGMFHQMLLDDVRKKEYLEQLDAQKRHHEMLERRKAYDEQIASANKKRREALRQERERERQRLEKMKEKIEQDHYEAAKRKKDQQLKNKTNFIEGHELKMLRLRAEKMKERELDNHTIRIALDELTKERIRKRNEMLNLRAEKEIFTEYFNREQEIAKELEAASDRIAQEWKQEEDEKTDEFIRECENERKAVKEKANQQYQRHLEELNGEMLRQKLERQERMERVALTAQVELQRKMENANEELRKQIEYRNALKNQIKGNQRSLESELSSTDIRDYAFTSKAEKFDNIMLTRFKQFTGRKSTNPVHPFKRIIDTKEARKPTIVHLPIIGSKYKYNI